MTLAPERIVTTSKREQAEEAMRHSWFPVARSVDLAKPQPATLLGTKLVVYRDGSGKAVVQSRRCPHRGGDFSIGEVHEGSIGCPYHGWEFSSTDGACVRIPSLPDQAKIPPKARIKTYPAVEKYGHVWTVLEEPAIEMYDPDEWREPEFVWLAADPIDSPVGVGVSIENFRDVAHFPFVHKVSMGPTPEVVEPLDVKRDGIDVWMYRPLDAGSGEWANDGSCMMKYHCIAPGLASITYDYEKFGKRIVAGFPSPISYEHVKIFWGVANAVDYSGASIEENLRVEEMVYLEDVPIVQDLEPREIPWDADFEEFSVPADKFTLNYRRCFLELMSRSLMREVRLIPTRVVAAHWEAPGITSYSLAAVDGAQLPRWEPGAHLDVHLPSGTIRQYSLCGDPEDRATYRIAVLELPQGRGGSIEVHRELRPGVVLPVGEPRLDFPLVDAERYVFVAGGIGITPLLPMVQAAQRAGRPYELFYGARSPSHFAFSAELESAQLITGELDLAGLVAAAAGAQVYACGPAGLLDALTALMAAAGRAEDLHLERFAPAAPVATPGAAFQVELARSGAVIDVAEDQTILDAVRAAGVDAMSSCEMGICGTCETKVLAGAVDHRDDLLTDDERAQGSTMMICVSRAACPRLVLDL